MAHLDAYVPDALKQPAVAGMTWWQLIAAPLLAALALIIGYVLARLSRALFTRLASRTSVGWDDRIAAGIGGPLTLGWTMIVVRLSLPWLELSEALAPKVTVWTAALLILALFWLLYRFVAVVAEGLQTSPWAVAHPAARAFVPLGARIARIAVFGLALVAVLATLGYPVASLIAGLGIGGVAVALAAKTTLENLFGAFALGSDQPFRVGDFVKVDNLLGNVEQIGLRSTRLRTLDRTLVTIPNGRLSDMSIESFAVRDRMRLACVVSLVYGSTAAQVRAVLAGIDEVLRAQPKLWPESRTVKLKELGASSIDVEVMAWFETPDWAEFQAIRQEVLLAFLEVVERAGTSFAFPTRTVHVVQSGAKPDAGPPRTSA